MLSIDRTVSHLDVDDDGDDFYVPSSNIQTQYLRKQLKDIS
jgi:hypothetical protein